MTDLERQIRVGLARQGGFSAHNIPQAVGHGPINEFVFAPGKTEAGWSLTDNTGMTIETGLGSSTSTVNFLPSGGPRNQPQVQFSAPYQIGGFRTDNDPRIITDEGFTIDSWVKFGSGTGGADIGFGLAADTGILPAIWGDPSAGPLSGAYVRLAISTATGASDKAFFGAQILGGPDGFRDAIVGQGGSGVQIGNGYNHYALEVAPDMEAWIYLNGDLMLQSSALGAAPDFSVMDVFVGADVFKQQNESVRPPQVAISGSRYRKGLAYGGQSFTP